MNLPEVNVFPVGDPALNSSAPVGCSTKFSILQHKGVVMLASRNFGSFESRSDLKSLSGGDREYSMSQLGFELVEDGLS